MRSVPAIALATAFGVLAPTHALAADSSHSVTVPLKNPWVAAGLSVGMPVTMAAAGFLLPPSHVLSQTIADSFVIAVASPLAIGAGHAYAGDPARGLLFSALVPVAIGASTAAGALALSGPQFKDMYLAPIGGALWGALIGGVTAFSYTAWDSFATAERKNEEATRQAQPLAGSVP